MLLLNIRNISVVSGVTDFYHLVCLAREYENYVKLLNKSLFKVVIHDFHLKYIECSVTRYINGFATILKHMVAENVLVI